MHNLVFTPGQQVYFMRQNKITSDTVLEVIKHTRSEKEWYTYILRNHNDVPTSALYPTHGNLVCALMLEFERLQ